MHHAKYFAGKEDHIISASDCHYKILRKWIIMDWCNNSVGTSFQVIKRIDEHPPHLEGKTPADIETSIQPWLCEADFEIPNGGHYGGLKAIDGCSEGEVKVVLYGKPGIYHRVLSYLFYIQ